MTTTENPIRNGVDTATLFATLDAVKGDTDLAKFQFRATNRGSAGPTTGRRSTASPAPGRSDAPASRSPSTPTTPPCSSGTTTARRRSSTCCTPSPPA